MGAPRLRILIVDDHQIIRAGLECLVEELGHEIVGVANTREEAVSSADQHKPDLILMDVQLEGESDGIEAATEIRKRLGIRSIFFSGYSDPDTRERANMADPIAFLDKTSSQADLARVINAVGAERAPSEPDRPSRLKDYARNSMVLFA
jgi:two-component system, response regulator PdtaR